MIPWIKKTRKWQFTMMGHCLLGDEIEGKIQERNATRLEGSYGVFVIFICQNNTKLCTLCILPYVSVKLLKLYQLNLLTSCRFHEMYILLYMYHHI